MRRSEIRLVKLYRGNVSAFGAVYDNFSTYAYKQQEKFRDRLAGDLQYDRRAYGVLCATDMYRTLAAQIKQFDDNLWSNMIVCRPPVQWLKHWHMKVRLCQLVKICPHCRFRKAQKAAGACLDRWGDLRKAKQYYARTDYFDNAAGFNPVYLEIGEERAKLIRGIKQHITFQTLYWVGRAPNKKLRFDSYVIVDAPKRYSDHWTIKRRPIYEVIQLGLKFPINNLTVTPEELFQLRHANYTCMSPSRTS